MTDAQRKDPYAHRDEIFAGIADRVRLLLWLVAALFMPALGGLVWAGALAARLDAVEATQLTKASQEQVDALSAAVRDKAALIERLSIRMSTAETIAAGVGARMEAQTELLRDLRDEQRAQRTLLEQMRRERPQQP